MVFGDQVKLEPVFFGIHRTGGGLWQGPDEAVSFAGWGVKGYGEFGPWYLETELVLMRFFGLEGFPTSFMPEQGFSWSLHSTGEADEFDTDYADALIEYTKGGVKLFAGKFADSWGPGRHSLTVSNKPPSYPRAGFTWQIGERFNFTYFHGSLHSQLEDTDGTANSPTRYGEKKVYYPRYIAAQRLEVYLPRNFTLGISEAVVYGDRTIEMIYAIPIVNLWSAQHYLTDQDNTQISADLAWQPSERLRLYGVWMMDEWTPALSMKDDNRNWFGWQAGAEGQSLLRPGDNLNIEATWTDHRINRHRFPVNDFKTHGYYLGHWIGPHAKSLVLQYSVPVGPVHVVAGFSQAERGELSEDMINDQYKSGYEPPPHLDGVTEKWRQLELTVLANVWSKLWLEAGVASIQWDNWGYDPEDLPDDLADDTYTDISKLSFTVGFYYNFKLTGYRVSEFAGRNE